MNTLTTYGCRYGLRVTVLAMAADPKWTTTKEGLTTGGPAAFGYASLVVNEGNWLTLRTVCPMYSSLPLRSTRHPEVSSQNLLSNDCANRVIMDMLGSRGEFWYVEIAQALDLSVRYGRQRTRCAVTPDR